MKSCIKLKAGMVLVPAGQMFIRYIRDIVRRLKNEYLDTLFI